MAWTITDTDSQNKILTVVFDVDNKEQRLASVPLTVGIEQSEELDRYEQAYIHGLILEGKISGEGV